MKAECAMRRCDGMVMVEGKTVVDGCLVCPYAQPCPTCSVPAGRRCKRPSGHRCRIHEPRLLAADRIAIEEHWDHVVAAMGQDDAEQWRERLVIR